MKKYILIVLSLFSISLSAYIPMSKNKDFKFKDEVCEYSDGDYTYVKPCDEGKYCETSSSLSIGYCKDVENKIKLKSINDECTSDFDCESNLECKSNKCLYSSTCASNESPVRLANGNWRCKKDDYKGLCFYEKKEDSTPEYDGGAEYFQICGKMTLDKSQEINGHIEYKPIKIESNYMGSVDDGEFVYSEAACKSGYALYFYGDGSLINPGKTTFPNQRMFKKCVSINDFDNNNNDCVIKYDNDNIYNVNKLTGKSTMSLNPSLSYTSTITTSNLCNEPLFQKEMWNKYINLYSIEKQKECEKNTDIDNPLTCDDNEISKWLYFYSNPDAYIAYYDEKDKNNDVINYLLQNHYQRHISSEFLNIKFIICLLFLILYI